MNRTEVLGVIVVLIPFTAIGIFAIATGLLADSVDLVSLTLGVVLLVCVGGMTRTWLRQR